MEALQELIEPMARFEHALEITGQDHLATDVRVSWLQVRRAVLALQDEPEMLPVAAAKTARCAAAVDLYELSPLADEDLATQVFEGLRSLHERLRGTRGSRWPA